MCIEKNRIFTRAATVTVEKQDRGAHISMDTHSHALLHTRAYAKPISCVKMVKYHSQQNSIVLGTPHPPGLFFI